VVLLNSTRVPTRVCGPYRSKNNALGVFRTPGRGGAGDLFCPLVHVDWGIFGQLATRARQWWRTVEGTTCIVPGTTSCTHLYMYVEVSIGWENKVGVLFLHKGERGRGSANDVPTGSLGPGVHVAMELWHVTVGGGKGRASTMSKHFVTKLFICIIPISHGTKRKVQEGGQGEMPGDEIRHR
jgi:hypothetical protein